MSLATPAHGLPAGTPPAATALCPDGVLNTAPCGFLTFTDGGTILRINETLRGWLGYGPQELEGRPLETIFSIGGRIFYQTHIFPLLKMRGRADEIHFSLKAKDGAALPVLTNAVRHACEAMFINDCVFLPMRQRGEYEAKLLQARKAADEASQAKASFLSRMSHELRTPMNAILGFGQLLEAGDLPPRQTQHVTQILKAGRHLLELINEVLDISRVEAGHLDMELEAVPVGELMSTVLDLARPLANQAGIRLQPHPGLCDADAVLADEVRLRQILLNLVANAIKYNRAGGEVTLGCEAIASGGQAGPTPAAAGRGRVRLVVSDTGHGISPENLRKLFSPFERLGAETSGIEGTGLGLSLCKQLAEAMGGQIGVRSVPGEGSTFWVDLPLGPGRLEPEAWPDLRDQTHQPGGDTASELLVLYVEDNSSNLALVEGVMHFRPSYRLISATTGTAGMELARTHTPDLILLDLQLPDLRGDVLIEYLQRDPRTRDIPIVMLSADATPRQIERLLKLGARDYLTKPVGVQQLLQTMDAQVTRQPAALAGLARMAG